MVKNKVDFKLNFALSILIFFILCSALVNAEIFLGQPKELYNLDDILEVSLSVKESSDAAGFLELNLLCPSGGIILHREYMDIIAQKEYFVDTLWPISATGLCHIRAEFNGDSVNSEEFTITDRIDATIELDKEHFLPGENLIISGLAVKANSQGVEGFAEISIPGLIEKQYLNVYEGSFNLEIKVPGKAEANEYELQVYIFEKNGKGEKTNNGFVKAKFSVSSIPATLDLSLNDEDFMPGEKIVVKPSLYDQAFQLVGENISIELKDSAGNIAIAKIINSGEELEYLLASDAIPGDWQIKATISDLEVKRFIYIQEYAAIVVEIQDNIIEVRNIGNVPYKKPFEIKFITEAGEYIDIKNLDLATNEEIEFKLTAPDGTYDIEAGGKKFTNVPLTGLVVGAIELKEKEPGFLMQYPLISFLIFILLLLLILLLSHGIKQNPLKKIARTPRNPKRMQAIRKIPIGSVGIAASSAVRESKSLLPVKKAESSLVLRGVKQKVSVLFIKIKNLAELKHKLSKTAFNTLINFSEKIITAEVEEQKGAIHKISDSETLAIFSPTLKQFRHEIAAIKTVFAIEQALKEHNRKLKEKLDYGLGVNSGDLVLNIKDVMLYTSIGKTIPIAKKIAEHASKEVLISKDVYLRASPEVKAQKVHSFRFSGEDIGLYAIKHIGGREVYKSYVRDILERMKKEE